MCLVNITLPIFSNLYNNLNIFAILEQKIPYPIFLKLQASSALIVRITTTNWVFKSDSNHTAGSNVLYLL